MSNLKRTLIHSLEHGIVCEILDYQRDYVGKQFDTIVGINQWSKEGHWCLITEGGAKPSFDRVKPILRPLSDLTKEIEHKGERFVPMHILIGLKIGSLVFKSSSSMVLSHLKTSSAVVDQLREWMFNLYNLSPDEFIEVTDDNNPYKA